MRIIRIEHVINGYVISTGEYGDKKSIYSNLDRAIDMVKKLMLDDERYSKEKIERNRNYKNRSHDEDQNYDG